MEEIDVYHFLSGAFCQYISIAKVVNLYVLDIVTICDTHVNIECYDARLVRRLSGTIKISKRNP